MMEAQPRRILMTADAVGGIWSYALTLAAALGRRSEILLAVMGPPPSAVQREAAAGIDHLRLAVGDFRLEWMAGAERDIDRAHQWLHDLAASFRPDLVHVNGFAAAATGWDEAVVVVAHSCVLSWWQAIHDAPVPATWDCYARRVAAGLAAAACVVAPTRAMLQSLASNYGFAAEQRVMVIANGCDLERFAPGRKEPVILSAGRFWDEGKNLAALDRAAARLPWHVVVAGECRHPERGAVVPRHAYALGPLSPNELAGWMSRAAIYALPARYEPFGLSVLEAAASGCALVLGDIPSLRELWQDAAIFVSPDDSQCLADAIAALMRDDRRRADLATRALGRARRLSAEAMGERYAALYDELASRGSRPAAGQATMRVA